MTKILFCNLVENIILHELIHIGILNDMIAILKTVWEMCKCKKKKKRFKKFKKQHLKKIVIKQSMIKAQLYNDNHILVN